ncbi:MAG: geranylgeranyl reductase family protein [Bacillota bacterium]
MKAEVIVIGAGPAGSWLAYNLAKNEVNVLILEKESWPRYKTCGGAVSKKTLDLIEEKDIKLPDFIVNNKVNKFEFRFDYEDSFSFNYEGKGIHLVNRDKFDDFLLQKACQAGAIFKNKEEVIDISILDKKVEVITENNSYECEIIVGADGANSRISNLLNLAPDNISLNKGNTIELELKYENLEDIPLDKDKILIDFGLIPVGYGWVFPKKNQLSIGLGHLKQVGKINLRKKINNYLKNLNINIKPDNLIYRGHPLPVFGDVSREIKMAGRRFLLIGDAAHLVDPMIGEGIYYACLSAELAAEVILKRINKYNYDLSLYKTLVEAELYSKFSSARKLADLFYNNYGYFKNFISLKPELLNIFLEVVQGNSSFEKIFAII